MANAESNGGAKQEQLPDLYRLLGLTPLESDPTKIQLALNELQRKVDAAQKTDVKLAQRAAKVVALGKKNLLEADRKSTYDRAWSKAFGSTSSTELESGPNEPDLEWDLEELETYLPAEDPRRAFDLGGFLRYSANQPESNPIADYDKLQSFLGGTATATLAAPESISAATLMPEYEQQRVDRAAVVNDPIIAARPSPSQRTPPGGFAKQIRKKRNRAMLLSVGGIVGSLVMVAGAYFFWANSGKVPAKQPDQLAQATKPEKTKPIAKDPNAAAQPVAPQGSGLPKVSGLDGSGSKPNMAADMTPNMAADNPAMVQPAMPTEPTTPATTPTPTTPTPPDPAPKPTEPTPPATPDPTPVPAADPVLTEGEKSKWSKGMKELLKTLGNQEFAAAKKQLTDLEATARTQLQKDQHKRISNVARLTEEYHGFLIDAINGLGASESFPIGSSTEAAFIEGNETSIALRIRGKNQIFKLTELQIGVANGLVDLKMDRAHPSSLARKAAFVLVHPKTNDLALKRAREQMAEAAGAGAVDADMTAVFDEDYSLKK